MQGKEENNTKTIHRLQEYTTIKDISFNKLSVELGLSNSYFSKMVKNGGSIGSDVIEKILRIYTDINADWLLTGRGSMLKTESMPPMGEQEMEKEEDLPKIMPAKRNRIPFYDDVSTIGGLNDRVASVDAASPSEWIDAGDWFPDATAAIRHYGDSMVEYPSGSILALKRVNDSRLIMNGRNYVIETTEYRVTKQLQDDGDCFIAYSTNRETYPDGHLVHSPFPVPKDAILHLDLVLGCVTKEYSNGAIQIRK